MDMSTISASLQALNTATVLTTNLMKAKVDSATLAVITEIQTKLNSALTGMIEQSSKLHSLQDENHELTKKIAEFENWSVQLERYSLVSTEGGAVVYKSKDETLLHYICPSCLNTKQIQILQPNGNYSGKYSCRGCKHSYQIKHDKPLPTMGISSGGHGRSWMGE